MDRLKMHLCPQKVAFSWTENSTTMKYDVFISYSRKDTAVADKICAAFGKVGITCFIDRQGISGGFEFPAVLAEAILESSIVLFLASENSYESKYTNAELTFAFNEKPKNSILPYIIDGSKMPPTFRLIFAGITWRTIEDHPIETVLVNDILNLLGRQPAAPARVVPKKNVIPSEPLCPCGSGKPFRHCHGSEVTKSVSVEKNKPSSKTWKVGDYYEVGDKKGVVFQVDRSGKHGKIVSLDQAKLQWCTYAEEEKKKFVKTYDEQDGMNNLKTIMHKRGWHKNYPAFAWCADHGYGWYLPAPDEMKELLQNDATYEKVNKMLVYQDAVPLAPKGFFSLFRYYWTSYEHNMETADASYVLDETRLELSKSSEEHVRAVCAF